MGDPYHHAVESALGRLDLAPGFTAVDVGAGTGSIALRLAAACGPGGLVYAVDREGAAADEIAGAGRSAGSGRVVALTQAAEEMEIGAAVQLAWCRFLLVHVDDPLAVLRRMAAAVAPGGRVVAQEPITSAGRVGGSPCSMPDAPHPDVGAVLPALVRDAGLAIVDAWAEAPAGVGPGPVASYLASLTGVDPGDDPVVLPPLVTVVGRKPGPD